MKSDIIMSCTPDELSNKNTVKLVAIFKKYHKLMHHVSLKILKDSHLAEDAVSETFIKLNRYIDKIGDAECKKTKYYVVTTTRNVSIDMWKKVKGKAEDIGNEQMMDMYDKDPSALDTMVSREAHMKVIAAIMSTNKSLKNVALLHFVHELSHHDIAKILNISYDSSKMRLSRAKKMIRDFLNTETSGGAMCGRKHKRNS